MAFTVTNRGAGSGSYVTSQAVSNSFTPTTGNLLIVMGRLNAAGTNVSSITGFSNTTFTQIQTSGNSFMWAAIVGASPGTNSLTLNPVSSKTVQAVTIEIAGADTSGTTANCFVQNQTLSQYLTSETSVAFPALAAFASATNLAMNFGTGISSIDSFAAETGFTKAVDSIVDDASVIWSVAAFYKTSEDTSMSLVESGSLFNYTTIDGIAFEVREAGGIALSPNGLQQNQTVDAISFSQHHNIAPTELSQSQQIQSASLTQHNVLTLNNLLQSQILDAVTFTQHHNVAPDSTAQAQTIGAPSFTVSGVLSAATLNQAQTIEVVTLTQHNSIAPAKLAQAQKINTSNLNPGGFSLVVASMSQAQKLDPAIFTQHNVLVVSDLTQQQILDGTYFVGAIGWLKGALVITASLNGTIEIKPSLDGAIALEPSLNGDVTLN